ncbi:TIGR03086 family protein [Kineococcus sp. R8]|uniref:TIGR03086 family metal-binding protein n=1 Tax=Kineococcus siccus TaxID=2696567 RepID=UPI001412F471|nr:TIGR03086 family metal-binding protein [Kineococcus siccus]NAZ82268.1 TIGR03086 family protein [Kineococcus siccus]
MNMATVQLTHRYERALTAARGVLVGVDDADLHRSTPCTEWDLADLLGHMLGQNHGFATALRRGDAPRSAYAGRPVMGTATLLREWDASARQLTSACSSPAPRPGVHLAEVAAHTLLPMKAVVAIHLLDTVVHTWDIATSLGQDHRPDDDILESVAATALRVPTGPPRSTLGAAFAPPVPATETDLWDTVLMHLGRHTSRDSSRLT